MHALGKRILDKTAAETRDRLSDIAREDLPTVEQARVMTNERNCGKEQEIFAPAWDRDRSDRVWQDALVNAAIEKEKIEPRFAEPRTREARPGDGQTRGRNQEIGEPIFLSKQYPIRGSAEGRFEDAGREVSKASKNLHRSVKVSKRATKTVGRTLDAVGSAVESLFSPTFTPAQIREAGEAKEQREAEGKAAIDFSKYTSDIAQKRQQLESDREAARRQYSERSGDRER